MIQLGPEIKLEIQGPTQFPKGGTVLEYDRLQKPWYEGLPKIALLAPLALVLAIGVWLFSPSQTASAAPPPSIYTQSEEPAPPPSDRKHRTGGPLAAIPTSNAIAPRPLHPTELRSR